VDQFELHYGAFRVSRPHVKNRLDGFHAGKGLVCRGRRRTDGGQHED
jgi:hypothetical protein